MENYDAIYKGLSRVEVGLESLRMALVRLRQGQNRILCLMVVGFILTFTVAIAGFVEIAVKLNALPGEFKRISETFSASLAAAANDAPQQTILIYAPTTPTK